MRPDRTRARLVIADIEQSRDDYIRTGLAVIPCSCGDASRGHSPDCDRELSADVLAEQWDDMLCQAEHEGAEAACPCPAMPALDQGPGSVVLLVGALRGKAWPGRSVEHRDHQPAWVLDWRRVRREQCKAPPRSR